MTALTNFQLETIITRRERARNYLEQYGAIQCDLMRQEQKYDNLDRQRFRWNQSYDNCGGGSGEKKDLGDIVANIDAIMEDTKRRSAQLKGFQLEIEAVVAHVQVIDPKAASAMREKYFVIGKSPEWKDVAFELNYSEAAVRGHNVKGLDIVAAILEERNYDVELYRFLASSP